MNRTRDISDYKVNRDYCETCPFKPDETGNYQDPELATEIIKTRLLSSSHICHTTDTTICRGMRNFHLQIFHQIGFLDEPTDTAWERARNTIK
jgi:hypothetical protein